MKLFTTMILAVALVSASGCRQVEPPVQASEGVNASKPVYTCAGRTKAGGACKRRVKVKGGYCWQHEGQQKGGK